MPTIKKKIYTQSFPVFQLMCKMHCNLKDLSEYANVSYKMEHVVLQYTTFDLTTACNNAGIKQISI